jgi:hypothetical protein
MQVLLLYGGHQKVIDIVGDGTELLLNNRPAESGALRFEIVSLDLCRMLWRYRTVGKNSGRLELADSR